MLRFLVHGVLAWLACAAGPSAVAAEVRVAVAASFAAPLAAITEGFERSSGHRLIVTAGASGKFLAQIRAGAPFDVLLAADQETPAKLVAEGLAVAGSQVTFATGRLVLWSTDPGLVDADGQVLSRGTFKHLAIANPKVAPYGRAAMQVLQARGVAGALARRLVTGESVAQAFQFVATGNAELGLVALSQIRSGKTAAGGSSWLVPQDLHAPIAHDAVLLSGASQVAGAQALLAYLRQARTMLLLRRFGYE